MVTSSRIPDVWLSVKENSDRSQSTPSWQDGQETDHYLGDTGRLLQGLRCQDCSAKDQLLKKQGLSPGQQSWWDTRDTAVGNTDKTSGPGSLKNHQQIAFEGRNTEGICRKLPSLQGQLLCRSPAGAACDLLAK